MFGKSKGAVFIITLILIGFCIYPIYLYVNGNINLYIHPRYNWFSLLMSMIGLSLLAAGLIYSHGRSKLRFRYFDVLLVVLLVLAFVVPAQPLSQQAIGKKSLVLPSYEQNGLDGGDSDCPEQTEPYTIDVWVYVLGYYDFDCFTESDVNIIGFVIDSVENPLPDNMYYLGRTVISCCVIDARPYALPVLIENGVKYDKDTWLRVQGKMQRKKVNGIEQVVIRPLSVVETEDSSKPYEFYKSRKPETINGLERTTD